MNKLFLSLLLLISSVLNFSSCKKKDIPNKESLYTTVEITVKNEQGKNISGVYVKMFDEKTYSLFKEDHTTKAQAESITNKDGIAVFTLENSKWFKLNESAELMFSVLEETDSNNYQFSSKGGTIKKNSKTKFTIILPEKAIPSVSSLIIENNVLKGITDKSLTSIVLPSYVRGIADNAFNMSSITEITLNDGIESIGDGCFLKSKIKNINFPSSLKYIGRAAFQDCTQLESADMSITQIETIMEAAFLDSGIKNIVLPKNLKKISSESFSGTANLNSIIISESIKEIGSRAFYKSGLENITLPNTLEKIGYMSFAECHKLSAVKKASGTIADKGIVDTGAFQNCVSLTEVNIPDNISYLKGYTFIGCEKLNKIFLPKSLKAIGEQGLRTNHNVGIIVFNSSAVPDFINENGDKIYNVLPFVEYINEISVPKQNVDEYKSKWTDYANKIKGF